MPNTPVLSLPYPASSDTADVPRDIQALATSLDAQQSFLPVGAIVLWGLPAVPAGVNPNGKAAWLFCLGQANVSAADYPKLAALLGQAGGFVTLPDLRDRVPLGASASKALNTAGGAETVTLTSAQSGLRAHTHAGTSLTTDTEAAHAHNLSNVAGKPNVPVSNFGWGAQYGVPTGTPAAQVPTTGQTAAVTQASVSAVAGSHSHAISGSVLANTAVDGAAHNNLPPYLALNYVMRAA